MVTLKGTHIVKPAEPTPQNVMYLSDSDQLKSLAHAATIYIYKPKINDHEFPKDAIQNFKDSLSKALVKFYPLAGRLYWTNGGRVELHCNSVGALILEAESQLRIDDLGDFCPDHRIRSLIPSVDYSYTATPIHEVPLLLVQLTRFSGGGISFGSAISLVAVDGQSALQFTLEWAKIARGEKSNYAFDPFFDRTILRSNEEHHIPQAFPNLKHSDYFTPLPCLIGQLDDLEERKKATTCITLRLSKEQIEKLKNKANQDHRGSVMISRFEAVSAYLWKCVSKARMLKPEQETVLYVSVDFRNRLIPPLPPTYFGNAVIPVPVRAVAEELLSKPLSYAANKIKEAIANVKDDYVRGYLAWAKNIPNVSTHRTTDGGGQGSFFGNPNLWIASWAGLPFYGANYGWGEELYRGPGSIAQDGRIFILANRNGNGSREGDGSFVIPLRLQMERVTALQRYFHDEILEMPIFYSQL